MQTFIDFTMKGVIDRVYRIENMMIEKEEVFRHLDEKASQDNVEKFMRDVYDMKNIIQKNMETFLNGEMTIIKLDLNKKISQKDLDKALEVVCVKDDLKEIKTQVTNIDFKKFTNDINVMIDNKLANFQPK